MPSAVLVHLTDIDRYALSQYANPAAMRRFFMDTMTTGTGSRLQPLRGDPDNLLLEGTNATQWAEKLVEEVSLNKS